MSYTVIGREDIYLSLEIPNGVEKVAVKTNKKHPGIGLIPGSIPKSVRHLKLSDEGITCIPEGVITENITHLKLVKITSKMHIPRTVENLFLKYYPYDLKLRQFLQKISKVYYSSKFLHVIRDIGPHWVYSKTRPLESDMANDEYHTFSDAEEINVFGKKFFVYLRAPVPNALKELPFTATIEDPYIETITEEQLNNWISNSKSMADTCFERELQYIFDSLIFRLQTKQFASTLHSGFKTEFRINIAFDAEKMVEDLKKRFPPSLLDFKLIDNSSSNDYKTIDIKGKWGDRDDRISPSMYA